MLVSCFDFLEGNSPHVMSTHKTSSSFSATVELVHSGAALFGNEAYVISFQLDFPFIYYPLSGNIFVSEPKMLSQWR